jgi:hypothetical protein
MGTFKSETLYKKFGLIDMKTLSLITMGFFLVFGATVSNGAVLTRISNETGVSVDTLQAERTSTGLGFGELETAHLLANASGQSFDDIVAMHKAGEGWGEIAHDNGLNLGKIVSAAHRSDRAALHAQNAHGQSAHTNSVHGKSHVNTTRGIGRGPSLKSGRGLGHGMGGMGHGHGGH